MLIVEKLVSTEKFKDENQSHPNKHIIEDTTVNLLSFWSFLAIFLLFIIKYATDFITNLGRGKKYY